MIDSETVVGTGLRITVAKDELVSRLAIVARGVSTPHGGARPRR